VNPAFGRRQSGDGPAGGFRARPEAALHLPAGAPECHL